MLMPRFIKRFFWTLLSIGLASSIAAVLAVVYFSQGLPKVHELADVHMQVPLRIYSQNHQLISQFGNKRRTPITLDQVPQPLIQAVLATEDSRYYEHPGVDPVGLVRAALAVMLSGHKVQGASTITMQVARNFFLTRQKTYGRKIREILLAIRIEQQFSKTKILELYLNKIYFGKRAYGVAAAAQVYYGLPLSKLTLAQMAMMAGLPQAPSRDNPLNNPKAALARRNHVLDRMLTEHYITQAAHDTAQQAPITAQYHGTVIQVYAPYIADLVRTAMESTYGKKAYQEGYNVYTTLNPQHQKDAQDALQQGLIAYSFRHGYVGPEAHTVVDLNNLAPLKALLQKKRTVAGLQPAIVLQLQKQSATLLYQDGHTGSLTWPQMQWARARKNKLRLGPPPKQSNAILAVGDVIRLQHAGAKNQKLAQLPKVQGALVSLDPNTGAIDALSGGFDFNLSHFNRATQSRRQAGSVFKPFIYSAALNKGYTLASIINDAPVVQRDTGENALWRPNNDSRRFNGPTRLIMGLARSVNLISIRLLQSIGIPYTLDYLNRFGFHRNDLPDSLSLALGTAQVSPLKLSRAYAVFANGGYYVQPYLISKIMDAQGKVIYQAKPKTACPSCTSVAPDAPTNPAEEAQTTAQPDLLQDTTTPQHADAAITPQNAYLMNHALQTVIQKGTGRAARALKRHDLGGKTGTTNDKVDAWFAGFNTDCVTIAWVGFDDNAPIKEYGAQAALPIWMGYMRQALKGTPEALLPEPPGLERIRINPKTGQAASTDDPTAIFELFRTQDAPDEAGNSNAAPSNTSGALPALANTVPPLPHADHDDAPLF
jgi:penicillin-binding protein 1A